MKILFSLPSEKTCVYLFHSSNISIRVAFSTMKSLNFFKDPKFDFTNNFFQKRMVSKNNFSLNFPQKHFQKVGGNLILKKNYLK